MSSIQTDCEKTSWDVIIVGAGISGINAAHHMHKNSFSYTVFEARDSIGGTWDLFRYPGIRSDSDLFSFGFPWYPWRKSNPIADAPSILQYLKDAGNTFGFNAELQLKHRVLSMDWSSSTQTWHVVVRNDSGLQNHKARFIILCTGYYDYHTPLPADIPKLDTFEGRVVHPQYWPEDYDYSAEKIVIIGSGATAITLVPVLAKKANHVTMLQRSPSYIAAIDNTSWLSPILPHRVTRLWWILLARVFYLFCRWFPKASRSLLQSGVQKALQGRVPLDPHFIPTYNPWDQRLCMCPDGDFFNSFVEGKASVVTGVIQEVQPDSILLKSGERLQADTIITATGLKLQFGGGIDVHIDNQPFAISSKAVWRGFMMQDLPNMSFVVGYTNASWTLGAEVSCHYTTRLLKHMRTKSFLSVTPRRPACLEERPLLNLNATYVQAAKSAMPVAGNVEPWVTRDSYWYDKLLSRFGTLEKDLEKVSGRWIERKG